MKKVDRVFKLEGPVAEQLKDAWILEEGEVIVSASSIKRSHRGNQKFISRILTELKKYNPCFDCMNESEDNKQCNCNPCEIYKKVVKL